MWHKHNLCLIEMVKWMLLSSSLLLGGCQLSNTLTVASINQKLLGFMSPRNPISRR